MTVTSLSAGDIAAIVGGDLAGDPDIKVAGVSPLERAGPGDLSFVSDDKYVPAFEQSRAGVVVLVHGLRDVDNGRSTRIFVPDAYRAVQQIMEHIYPSQRSGWGVSPLARIGRGVSWTGRVHIGAYVTIEPGVRLGPDCRVGERAMIGERATLGARVDIHPHALVAHDVRIGDDVVVQAGARVGTDGFGYVPDKSGHAHIKHVGGCIIGTNVEIGANTTIDRGTIADTIVGDGTKIDNLVHIAHNCRVGRNCLIMAQVGMAGSTIVEDDVMLAGQAGLAGHLTIGRGARIAAQSGVIGDVAPSATVSGYPARDHREVLRQAAATRRLTRHVKALEDLLRTSAPD